MYSTKVQSARQTQAPVAQKGAEAPQASAVEVIGNQRFQNQAPQAVIPNVALVGGSFSVEKAHQEFMDFGQMPITTVAENIHLVQDPTVQQLCRESLEEFNNLYKDPWLKDEPIALHLNEQEQKQISKLRSELDELKKFSTSGYWDSTVDRGTEDEKLETPTNAILAELNKFAGEFLTLNNGAGKKRIGREFSMSDLLQNLKTLQSLKKLRSESGIASRLEGLISKHWNLIFKTHQRMRILDTLLIPEDLMKNEPPERQNQPTRLPSNPRQETREAVQGTRVVDYQAPPAVPAAKKQDQAAQIGVLDSVKQKLGQLFFTRK